jgi:mannose-1-phosphate guanylyltransferase/mannose-6-phosphate isomerase
MIWDRGKHSGRWEKKDDLDNVVKGDVVLQDVADSYLHAESRLIAAVGLKDHIVVETSDAVMISPRDRVQDVKGLVDRLQKTGKKHGPISGAIGHGVRWINWWRAAASR